MTFVVIEGIDGCGKSEQSSRLARTLGAKLYSFPNYATETGVAIKAHLSRLWAAQYRGLGPGGEGRVAAATDALVFQCLQLANKVELADDIRQDLWAGRHVLAARYWPSAVVYGTADGLAPAWLLGVHRALPQPGVFVLLDIDVEESFRRRPYDGDRYESDRVGLAHARELYRELWESKGDRVIAPHARWVVLDGAAGDVDVMEKELSHQITRWQLEAYRA